MSVHGDEPTLHIGVGGIDLQQHPQIALGGVQLAAHGQGLRASQSHQVVARIDVKRLRVVCDGFG